MTDMLPILFIATQALTAGIAVVWLILQSRQAGEAPAVDVRRSQLSRMQSVLAEKDAALKEKDSEIIRLIRDHEEALKVLAAAQAPPAAPAAVVHETPRTCKSPAGIPAPVNSRGYLLDSIDGQKDKKIGEILLEHHFIVKDILDKALQYQVQHGGTITQYLLAYGYIDESQLAKCLCSQFKIPYLPLSSCEIPERVIKLIPVDIAEKYLVVPVDQAGDSLMVVMADPLDVKALAAVKKVTGCTLKPFVGILSEIVGALETYYHVNVRGTSSKSSYPFVVESPNFRGIERREAIRFKCEMDVQVPIKGIYQNQKTKDISRDGFCFESDCAPPMGAILTMEVYLPKEFSPLPIRALVQVMRIVQRGEHKYEIGVKTIEIAKHDLAAIINYAASKSLGCSGEENEEKPEKK